ncbi:hypothetical protein [Lentzea sp. NPDC004782]|uniref:hypothetical protein n=1 Tax=Lentzea sp. NPDC004782 TaxID=3154458 RepID=UPI0033B32CB3
MVSSEIIENLLLAKGILDWCGSDDRDAQEAQRIGGDVPPMSLDLLSRIDVLAGFADIA